MGGGRVFLAVQALGLLVFRDYGLSIDEYVQHEIGMISLKHVAQRLAPACGRRPRF